MKVIKGWLIRTHVVPIITVWVAGLLISEGEVLAANRFLNYKGQITEANGVPINGFRKLRFRVESGGVRISEILNDRVKFKNGNFSVCLSRIVNDATSLGDDLSASGSVLR